MNFRGRILVSAKALCAGVIMSVAISAQSTSQDYPTPVTGPEITGTIHARDIGDARLTTYYYQFDGEQGDLFMNLVTRNLTGDIDVFTLNGLRPLAKIVVYADLGETETGRVIYLRKPERLLLRVQGRTPGDDPATFRIKFAGSFSASKMPEPPSEPALPSVTSRNESGIRVNSVGTIVEVIPKPTPTASEITDELTEASPTPRAETPARKVEVVVTDNAPPASETTTTRSDRNPRRTSQQETSPAETAATPAASDKPAATRTRERSGRSRAQTPERSSDPLEKVNLVILFKDGSKIERPLTELNKFTVDKGVLTLVARDGTSRRYSMLDVAKVTIQ